MEENATLENAAGHIGASSKDISLSFHKAVIFAPGLLGASLLQAIHREQLAQITAAWARRPETRIACEGKPWCNDVFADKACAVKDADLVVLCAPVDHIGPLLADISPHLPEGCLVTDVGSTKSLICRKAREQLDGSSATFIGSHPMAGSEKTGLENARPDLFEGRACFVTPLPDSPPLAVERIVALWTRLGMRVKTTTPEAHDEMVAHNSHLPHMMASVLASFLAGKDPSLTFTSGEGLRDTTRIAAGDPALWTAICEHNREEILRAMDGFELELQALRRSLHNRDFFAVEALLKRGQGFRKSLG